MYVGLALGATRGFGDDVWTLAVAALALQTARHQLDFAWGATRQQAIAALPHLPLEQPDELAPPRRRPAPRSRRPRRRPRRARGRPPPTSRAGRAHHADRASPTSPSRARPTSCPATRRSRRRRAACPGWPGAA